MSEITELHERFKPDTKISELGINVPKWIESDVTISDVAGIYQGGCASGAYMPAVTYHVAHETMHDHGNKVLDFISDRAMEYPYIKENQSWKGHNCDVISLAVELWAMEVVSELLN